MGQTFHLDGTAITYTVEFREGEIRVTTHIPDLGIDAIGALDMRGAAELVRQLTVAIQAAATLQGERHGKAN